MSDRFAAAAPDEPIVHGDCAPGGLGRTDPETVEERVETWRDRGIERVVVLLSDRQVDRFDDLLGRYRAAFGADRVLHAPIPDHHLAAEDRLREVLSFLDAADEADERVVVHCLAGIGRTGHVLAAWLVHARGYEPEEAVDAVADTGRNPAEAVRSGNATEADLYDLLEAVGQGGE